VGGLSTELNHNGNDHAFSVVIRVRNSVRKLDGLDGLGARPNVDRQLRPFFLWSVSARKAAWLRSWRLYIWWRRCPEK
jgi:hypothetical protein